jgi:hypothetical protein
MKIDSNDLTGLTSHKAANQSVNFIQLSQPINMSYGVRQF